MALLGGSINESEIVSGRLLIESEASAQSANVTVSSINHLSKSKRNRGK
jgi:hypothetical protein